MYCRGNRAAAGMALMSSAIFTVEQVGVDRDSSVTDIHKKQFIGQREKILAGVFETCFLHGYLLCPNFDFRLTDYQKISVK